MEIEMTKRRVVITGMGIWSCIGTTINEVQDSLYNGKSGIILDEDRLAFGYRSPLVGKVPQPQLKGLLERKQRAGLSEEAEYAYMATRQALQNANVDDTYLANNEVGVVIGNDSSALATVEIANTMAEKHDTSMLGSSLIFQSMNSTVNMNLSTIFNMRGINLTVSAACASSSHAIGLGYLLIQQGLQDMILCGGAQEVNVYAVASFDALSAFSVRTDDPTRASRPFDRDRDGLIPSGGAAAIVIEEYEHAKARGANILAEIVGYGFSSNGSGVMSKASADGSMTAMQRALNNANLKPSDIDYINAHATSTPQGDAAEAIALDRIFNGTKAIINSTKSMTGHEMWMAGTSEIVYSLIMMQNNFVAPNINFENPDENSQPLNIARQTVNMSINTLLSNSFGFGGTNSALILRKI